MRYFQYPERIPPEVDVIVTVSEKEILRDYYPEWRRKMLEKFTQEEFYSKYSEEDCIQDWKMINFASEVKPFATPWTLVRDFSLFLLAIVGFILILGISACAPISPRPEPNCLLSLTKDRITREGSPGSYTYRQWQETNCLQPQWKVEK